MTFVGGLKPRVLDALGEVKRALLRKQRPAHPLDLALGIETSRAAPRVALNSGSELDRYSRGLVASAPSVIRKCLDVIGIDLDMDFIDLGCGKGRPMVVAAEFPFRSLTGIELSPYISKLARRNIARLHPKERYGDRMSIVEGDASKPDLGTAPAIVLFLYHSFDRPLVETLVAHLDAALSNAPGRKVWLIYYNPVHYEVFDASGAFARYFAAQVEFDADDRSAALFNPCESVIIYQSTNVSVRPPCPGASAKLVTTVANVAVEVVNDA